MLTIIPVPALSDNYVWMLRRPSARQVVIIDPGEARGVLQRIEQEQLEPVAILITHQHYDHVNGVAGLLEQYPGLRVYGPAQSLVSATRFGPERPIPELITHPLNDGDTVEITELDIRFQVLAVSGHTLDHIAYYGEGALFCGDTLFGCGCGRLLGGNAEQFEQSLSRIAALPKQTKIYCAHEYTLDNIGFAKWVEPESIELQQRDDEDMAKQEQGLPTIPSSLELELKTNPFLRYNVPQVKQAAERYIGHSLQTDAEVFAAIRAWKDREYD